MRYVWVVQCNLIECTDEIYIFTSRKKADKFMLENDEYIDVECGDLRMYNLTKIVLQ